MKHRITVILSILFLAGCMQRDTSAEWDRILDVYVEAWNTGNLELLDGIIDAQFVRTVGSTILSDNIDSLKIVMASIRETYPDFYVNVTVDERIHSGDLSAGRWSWSGTHSGLGNPALKGKQVSNTGMSSYRMRDGKLVEEWVETNQLSLMLQLGYTLTPPPGADE
ncbi:MAG: ester cyclase [Candidatus Marinimicrobia bacterium]|nr:ester cyclase [Candidatus Neomarinimicrobiota bacterium]